MEKYRLTSRSNKSDARAQLKGKDGEEAGVGGGDGAARESPSCCYSCFLLCSALPRSACLFGGLTARLPHFLHSFLHFSDSAHPFQHPTSSSPPHAEGKNADSTVIIQLELLTGAILAVLNSLPTRETDLEYSLSTERLFTLY